MTICSVLWMKHSCFKTILNGGTSSRKSIRRFRVKSQGELHVQVCSVESRGVRTQRPIHTLTPSKTTFTGPGFRNSAGTVDGGW